MSSGFWHASHQVTRFAGRAIMYDRGTIVGRIVKLDEGRHAALIRHPRTDEELVIGVWGSHREACSRLWELHSAARDRKLGYLDGGD